MVIRSPSRRGKQLIGTSGPSAFAVLKLITSSNLVGCSTGISPRCRPAQNLVGKAVVTLRTKASLSRGKCSRPKIEQRVAAKALQVSVSVGTPQAHRGRRCLCSCTIRKP
jgi:hypothetical protein